MGFSPNDPTDEVAQAEAELRAAQARLDAARARQAQAQGGGQQPTAQPNFGYQQGYQQSYAPTKDHVAAGLLAIFLGPLGVHKFYLGYNVPGFIMLAVSVIGGIFTISVATWIVWIIAIIEGIIYLTKNQTDFEQLYVFSKREWF